MQAQERVWLSVKSHNIQTRIGNFANNSTMYQSTQKIHRVTHDSNEPAPNIKIQNNF